jgi:hypothetical protein
MIRRAQLTAFGGVLILAACAQPQPGTPAFTAAEEQHRQEQKTEAVKDAVGDMPSWYLTPPGDDTSLYAPGTATSGDLQFAVDKAVIGAKRALADRINSRLSSKLKEFLSESGAADDARAMVESERVTNNLITEVNLSGYQITEKTVMPAGSQFRAYVLVQYPLGKANRILLDQIQKSDLLESKVRASKAFQELEKDIDAAKPAAPQAPAKPEDKKPEDAAKAKDDKA